MVRIMVKPIRKIQVTDYSIRDLPQRVIIMPDVITVQSFVGRVKVSEYNIFRRDWTKLCYAPTANPNWNKAEFIRKNTMQYDTEQGGLCQADRIRDSQCKAIDAGLQIWDNRIGG